MHAGAGFRDIAGAAAAALAAAVLLALPRGPAADALAVATAAVIAGWIALEDAAAFTIPDGAVAGLALLGLAVRWRDAAAAGLSPGETTGLVAAQVAIVGGGLWAVREIFYRRRGVDGLGLGDVKLGAAATVLTGAPAFALALAAASLAGIAVLVLRHGRSADLRSARLPLGSLLAPAVALVFLAGRLDPTGPLAGGLP